VSSSFTTAPNGAPVYNQAGYTGDFKGSALPFTPKFSATADAQYDWKTGSGLKPFLGGSIVYVGKNNGTFETEVLKADDFEFRSYATVDLRAGISSSDDKWRITLFGRNVFNKYYNTTIFSGIDTQYRFAGMPATYGVAVRLRFD
jgi:outer membrane receptor protein involved in Fe transport